MDKRTKTRLLESISDTGGPVFRVHIGDYQSFRNRWHAWAMWLRQREGRKFYLRFVRIAEGGGYVISQMRASKYPSGCVRGVTFEL